MKRKPPTVDSSAERRFTRGLVFIGIGALVLRLAYLAELDGDPLAAIPIGDGWQYDGWARKIVAGEWTSPQAFYQAPLYPYFLAAIYTALGHSFMAVRAVQAVLGAASCALLGIAGRRFLSGRVGLLAAGLLAVYPFAIFSDGIIQKSSVDAFLVTAMLASLAIFMARPHWRWLIAAGLSAGAFAINRETGRLLYPVVVAWLLAYAPSRPMRTRLAWSAVFTVSLAAVLAPVAVHNYRASGDLLLSTSQAGPNFYIGNNPGATGIYEPLVPGGGSAERERDDAVRLAEEAAGRRLSAGEVSQYWLRRSFEYIRAEPGRWLRLTARKLLLTLNAAEISDTESVEIYAEHSRVLAGLSWFTFGVVLPLAVLGIWRSRALWKRLALLYAALIVTLLSVAAFFVLGRYRYPAIPIALLFSASGVEALLALRREGARGSIPGLVLAAGALVVAHLPLTSAYRDTTLYNVALGYLKADREAEAIPWLQQAVQRAPDDAAAYFALGVTHNRLGQAGPAVDALRSAARLRPDDPETRNALAVALRNLGTAFSERGEHAQAVAAFRESLAAHPDDPSTLNNLGLALYAEDRAGDAIAELQAAIRLKPDYGEAHANLALILEEAGDVDGAKAHFEAARRLQPDHARIQASYDAFVRRHGGR